MDNTNKIILRILKYYDDRPTLTVMSQETNMSTGAIRHRLSKLIELGFVTKKGSSGKGLKYILTEKGYEYV